MHILAPKYYREFTCIGSECESNCCEYPWSILVDKSHYKKIKKISNKTTSGKEEFNKNIKRTKNKSNIIVTDRNYAYINHKSDGACGFLNSEKLCGLVTNHGDKILPSTCNNYPRVNNAIGDQVQTGLYLSCPEATRKCLLDENSFQLKEIEKIGLGDRAIKAQVAVNLADDSDYNKQISYINGYVEKQLTDTGFPLKTRLFILTFFANKSRVFLSKEGSSEPAKQLLKLTTLLDSKEVKSQLHTQLNDIHIPSEIGMGILQECIIIQPSITDGTTRMFSTLFSDVMLNIRNMLLTQYNVNLGSNIKTSREEMSILWEHYQIRKTSINKKYRIHIEKRLTKYCLHFWMVHWYSMSNDLLMHMRKCLLNKAIISFLFYNHPELNRIGQKEDEGSHLELIDKVLVNIVSSYSRDTESLQGVSNFLENYLDEKQFVDFAPIMLLIDF